MDFKEYAVRQRMGLHKDVLLAICMATKNCADCFSDETRRTDCSPTCRLRNTLIRVTENGFYIESYNNSKVNRELLDLANDYGYKAGLVKKEDIIFIKFWK